jgi:pyoluteorin transport system permease protein
METLHRILILCRKELLSILKDRSSRIVLIGPVIMQSLIFGYAATYDLSSAPYALLDRDRSGASAALVARLEGSGVFRRVADLQSPQQVASAIDSKQALLVVQIDENFERQLASGASAVLQVVLDGRNSNTAGVAFRYVAAMVESFNGDWRARHGGSGAPPLTVESRAWYNPNLETRWQMVPSLIAVLSMLQTMILTALSVAREREQGTFDQLLVTPLRSGEIMVGKAVPSIIIGLAQSTFVLLLALFWFRIPFAGSLLTLYVGLLVYMVASVGIGLAISALSANMQQAMLYAFVLLMPLMLLSGLATPIASMPKVMQYVTLIDPVRYGLEIVRRVYLEGVGLTRLFNDLWPLALMALVTLPAAAWLFRNRLI